LGNPKGVGEKRLLWKKFSYPSLDSSIGLAGMEENPPLQGDFSYIDIKFVTFGDLPEAINDNAGGFGVSAHGSEKKHLHKLSFF